MEQFTQKLKFCYCLLTLVVAETQVGVFVSSVFVHATHVERASLTP